MAEITVMVSPYGKGIPPSNTITMDISSDMPPNIIGEAVIRAIKEAESLGYRADEPALVITLSFTNLRRLGG